MYSILILCRYKYRICVSLCLTLWTTANEIGQITRGGGLFLAPPPSISKTTHDLTTKMCTYMLQIVFFPILK